jgi:hypothetical protein
MSALPGLIAKIAILSGPAARTTRASGGFIVRLLYAR